MKNLDLSRYHKLDVTVAQYERALGRLGYQKHDRGGKYVLFVNPRHKNAKILVPKRAGPDDWVPKSSLHGETWAMFMQGIITDVNDFANLLDEEIRHSKPVAMAA